MNETNTAELMPMDRINEDPRGDGWFVTMSGLKFFPLKPHIEDILIQDIAFALSNICRFGGHVQFYSVAEHCCHIADAAPVANKMEGLLHDTTEAYMGDMVRPLKHQMPEYRKAEDNLWLTIAERFNLPVKMSPIIKELDSLAMLTERNHLMKEGPNTRNWYWDTMGMEPLPFRVRCWSPEIARREFMRRFDELTRIGGEA